MSAQWLDRRLASKNRKHDIIRVDSVARKKITSDIALRFFFKQIDGTIDRNIHFKWFVCSCVGKHEFSGNNARKHDDIIELLKLPGYQRIANPKKWVRSGKAFLGKGNSFFN